MEEPYARLCEIVDNQPLYSPVSKEEEALDSKLTASVEAMLQLMIHPFQDLPDCL